MTWTLSKEQLEKLRAEVEKADEKQGEGNGGYAHVFAGRDSIESLALSPEPVLQLYGRIHMSRAAKELTEFLADEMRRGTEVNELVECVIDLGLSEVIKLALALTVADKSVVEALKKKYQRRVDHMEQMFEGARKQMAALDTKGRA